MPCSRFHSVGCFPLPSSLMRRQLMPARPVLAVDPLTHALTPLYTDRSIPSARKSVVWSAPTSYYQEELYLFSSGAGEMLQVCRVSISASTTATSASISNASDSSATAVHTSLPTVKLHVRPWTAAKALTSKQEEKEKGSVRVMDLAVQPLPSAGGQKHVVLAGYSDGKLRVRLADSRCSRGHQLTSLPRRDRSTSLTQRGSHSSWWLSLLSSANVS